MRSEMNISMNQAVPASSRLRRSFAYCASTLAWHTATIAAPAKHATKRNLSALEELRTE